ncbi:MAG: prepilin-type N-terminal cleavage/methylation domain-containing protein [Magnetococcales bacterium]|nr:prepilin-type N-terminal cleavage/methylation domain-containing protein [Magnetococcales bacterium]
MKRFFKKSSGFTLIELLLVLAILAIVASVGIPAYTGSILKAHRSEAKAALMEVYLLQVEYFQDNYTYANLSTLVSNSYSNLEYYTITITPAIDGDNPSDTFTAKATAIGTQADDGACLTYTIDETGEKGSTGTGTASDCWGI